jgi:hypothetical protein
MREDPRLEYPLCDNRFSMLELLDRLLKEARARDEDVLWLEFYRGSGGGDPSRLRVHESSFDIVEALGVSGAEANGMLRDLGDDGYLRLRLDRYGLDAGAGLAGVTLTQKGFEAIRNPPFEKATRKSKEYPQWERRKRLLRAVHDWCETRTDVQTQLRYHRLLTLVEDPAYEGILTPTGAGHDRTTIDNAQARVMNLFVMLVKDGYIDADIGTEIVGLPFTSARVRGLTDKGLRAIGEMPDPDEEIERVQLERQREVQEAREELSEDPYGARESESIRYDVFISHASEDKKAFVEPLANLLSNMGFRVWYDDFTLKVGDRLRRSIEKGLADSKYGIVVLSPAFFDKEWLQRELDGLTAREIAGGKKVILPIWHDVGQEEVLQRSPTLADVVAIRTRDKSFEEIAEDLAEALRH